MQMSPTRKAALKNALRKATEGLHPADKLELLVGAEWGAKEVSGDLHDPHDTRRPEEIDPYFLKGRQIVLDLARL